MANVSISRWHIVLLTGAMLGGIAGALTLYFFDPVTSGIYPVCTLHQLTGLSCPGCGGLRAMHQLVHGNLAGAWHFNALLVCLLPCAGWLALRELIWFKTGSRPPGIITRPFFAWVLLTAIALFGILRNFHV